MMLKIFLVRHGENRANITKDFSYKIVDYSLNEKGEMQALQTAKYFDSIKINRIYTSPLKRAVETAEAIKGTVHCPVSIMEEFREVNVGELENKEPTKENWNVFLDIIDNWINGNTKCSFADGENYHELTGRFVNGMKKIIDENVDGNIIIVGHGMIFTQGMIEFACIADKKAFYEIKNYNCSISQIEIERKEEKMFIKLIEWASIAHLSGIAAEVNEPMMLR